MNLWKDDLKNCREGDRGCLRESPNRCRVVSLKEDYMVDVTC